MNITWSYSSLKTFEQCPKKFYHLKVVKDYQEDQGAEHVALVQAVYDVEATPPTPCTLTDLGGGGRTVRDL